MSGKFRLAQVTRVAIEHDEELLALRVAYYALYMSQSQRKEQPTPVAVPAEQPVLEFGKA